MTKAQKKAFVERARAAAHLSTLNAAEFDEQQAKLEAVHSRAQSLIHLEPPTTHAEPPIDVPPLVLLPKPDKPDLRGKTDLHKTVLLRVHLQQCMLVEQHNRLAEMLHNQLLARRKKQLRVDHSNDAEIRRMVTSKMSALAAYPKPNEQTTFLCKDIDDLLGFLNYPTDLTEAYLFARARCVPVTPPAPSDEGSEVWIQLDANGNIARCDPVFAHVPPAKRTLALLKYICERRGYRLVVRKYIKTQSTNTSRMVLVGIDA